uniref:MIF4G domain-containing protein n=1 Tax=Gossypium raimondii TaxID=29730 RepID=A0A0D2QYR3_GOSRA|nr:hypothetical protein B456_004G038100 [Gossypium raimondii]
MSFKQSRSDKSEQQQYRKLGRSASSNQQQRTSSGVYGEGGGGGPAPSSSFSSSSSSSRSSAPPNLDEQKCDQACHGSSVKSVSNLPTTVPRQQLPRKDSVASQSNSGEAHPMPMVKKDVQASAGPAVDQTQKSSHLNIPMASMQMPFHHQPQVPMQFGVTNPHIQSQSPSVSGNIEKDGSGNISMKYSRDFLPKFAEQCTDLPQGFEIASDIAEPLMTPNVNGSHLVDRDSYLSPGRKMDRQSSGSRLDRRGRGMVDNERWVKLPGSFRPGRDTRLDPSYGAAASFQPVQGGNFGIVRHPRAQTSLPFVGGILAGPMHPMGLQGGMPRNSPDTDRWQPVANYSQKGLISSPQTPLQTMHRAARKYEMGKVTDEETLKQRQLKAILNKLTPQNFEKLFEQVKAVNIDNAVTLTGVILQIFDKALMEPKMYANFCYHLAGELPEFSEGNEKITFKRLLLNKCQEEFERGGREQEEANKVEEVGESKRSEEEREEKRIKARRRMLGNIRFIGELYKKKMLTERIMHECIKKLLGEYENPDEEDIEALCKLMSTIGEMIDHPKAKVYMDAYFERMAKLSNNVKLSSRVRFMLKGAIDLRKNKWQQRRKVDGPKKIEEVDRDAAQERQAQASRLAHGPGINPAARRAPSDFGPRASVLSSPGPQDARMDDRLRIETRNLCI